MVFVDITTIVETQNGTDGLIEAIYMQESVNKTGFVHKTTIFVGLLKLTSIDLQNNFNQKLL